MATKTVLPGMSAEAPSANQFAPQNPAGTIVPGSHECLSSDSESGSSSKPILGFLYSVSKTPFGEFWPLYLGPNTIGRSKNNSICLPEASVSESHATIVIRRMQHQGEKSGIFVFVQDTGSTCGTLLNGDTLDFNPRECNAGDIITIGANYELYLILIDPEALKLSTKENFQPVEIKSSPVAGFNPRDWAQNQVNMNTTGVPKGTIPGTQLLDPNQPNQQQSSNPFNSRKATIYMPQNNK